MRYRFQDFEIDYSLYELWRAGEKVRIDRKVFDLLRYLIDHRERVVRKDELLREVWRGEAVVDAVIPTAVARLRKALDQRGSRGGPIETAHGRGYRFVAPLASLPPRRESSQPSILSDLPANLDTDLHPGLRDAFVGREEIMQRLSGALDRVLTDKSRVRVLIGEPGIGKTRITQELANRAQELGLSVWAGRCHESDREQVLWPWMQLLRGALEQDTADALRKLSPAIRRRLSMLLPELHSESLGGAEPEQAPNSQLFEAVRLLLRECAAQRPRLLLIDDLHWADPASLNLLEYLATELRDARVLIVGSFRDAELPAGDPHLALLDRMKRAASFKLVEVPPLQPSDVEAYIYGFTGQHVSDELVETIYERTAGNAFFVRETVRSLTWSALREGHLDLSAVVLPQSARDVVRRRIALLSAESRKVLETAAAIGERFELPLLRRALSLDTDSFLDALDEAEAARLVIRADDMQGAAGSYAFTHALLQETIYDDLSRTRRCDLHQHIAEALEAEHAMRPGATLEIAYHFHQALPYADGQKVLEYGVRAAERAASRDDHEDEARWYRYAYDGLRYAPRVDPERGAELMLARGRALREGGKPVEARQVFERLIQLAEHGKASGAWAEDARKELSQLK